MALSFTLNNLEGVDDALKGLYKQENGVYILDVTGAESAESVAGLKNALESQKGSVAALRQEKADAEKAASEAEQQRLLDAGKHEEYAANIADELKSLKADNEHRRQESLNATKKTEALNLAGKVGKDANAITILSKLFEMDMNYSEAGILQGKEGETLVQMLDRVNKCGMYDSLIKGSGASGADLHNAGGQGHKKLSEMTGTEEAVFAKSNPEDYAAMLKK